MRAMLDIPDDLSGAALDAALEGLVQLGMLDLEEGRAPLSPVGSGVVYAREPRGSERWMPPSMVLGRGQGDCEDLAGWYTAGLRVSGIDPEARAVAVRTSPRTWHAVVQRSDGTLEDPSAELGMTAPGGLPAPVRFALLPMAGRDYAARVEVSGGGGEESYTAIDGCPVCALAGALDAAGAELGQVPFVGPLLDLVSQATQAATGRPMPLPTQRGGAPALPSAPSTSSLESGVLDLAMQLRRIAKTEAARLAREGRRR